jgi:uncharacterized protein
MDMPLEVMLNAIEEAIRQLESRQASSPNKSLIFEMFITGGEPILVWPALRKALQYAKSRLGAVRHVGEVVFTPHIVTNGTLIDDTVAAQLAESETVITVALDSPFNEVRVDASGTPATPSALVGLKRLIKAGHKRTSVNVVVPGETFSQIDRIFGYLEDQNAFKGVTSIQLSPLAPPIQHTEFAEKKLATKRSGYLDPNVCREFSMKLIEYSIRYGLDMKQYGAKVGSLMEQGGARYRCPVAEWKWCVSPNSDVWACHQLVGIEKFRMGNLMDRGWYDSPHARSIRDLFLGRTVESADLCRDCVLSGCCMVFVDCPARSFLEMGDVYLVTPHYCECGKTYLECLFGEHLISLADRGRVAKPPFFHAA